MAYAVLRSLDQTIRQILNRDKYPISSNGRGKLYWFLEKVNPIQKFLEEYKEEGSSLERRIVDAANEAEDVMEHWMHEHIRSPSAMDIEYDLGELNMAMEEMNSIAEEVKELQSSPTTTPAVDRNKMLVGSSAAVGLEEQVDKLRVLLFNELYRNYIISISITGMGGIGKTTLARAVFQDDQVVNHFPLRAWITVSQNYDTETIFEELLLSLEKQVGKGLVNDCDTTEYKLGKILEMNKHLIVVDDLWSNEAWREIERVIWTRETSAGSRVLITTRVEDVVSYTPDATYMMVLEIREYSGE